MKAGAAAPSVVEASVPYGTERFSGWLGVVHESNTESDADFCLSGHTAREILELPMGQSSVLGVSSVFEACDA